MNPNILLNQISPNVKFINLNSSTQINQELIQQTIQPMNQSTPLAGKQQIENALLTSYQRAICECVS